MYRMVLYPVHPLIFKILYKKMGRARGVLLQAKKCHDPLSEHDFRGFKGCTGWCCILYIV